MIRFAKSVIIAAATVNLGGATIAQEIRNETKNEIILAKTQQAETQVSTENADLLFGLKAMTETNLQLVAGREDISQVSKAEQTAEVSRNSVGANSSTGSSQVDGNAFQNMSGLSILNINTGNNVAINASMNVNISITPSQ